MLDILTLWKWPLIASLILPWLLVYLGLHIVRRGVIFVDLALAQMAAFGTCMSMVYGYDVHDWQSYVFSLGFTFVGAVLLTFTRTRHQTVPQEALIGIVYVVAAAALGSAEIARNFLRKITCTIPMPTKNPNVFITSRGFTVSNSPTRER